MYVSLCKVCIHDERGAECTHPKNTGLDFWNWTTKGKTCPYCVRKDKKT